MNCLTPLEKKAVLLCERYVYVEHGVNIDGYISRSSAGPGAGGESINIEYSGSDSSGIHTKHRVRMAVSNDSGSRCHLKLSEKELALTMDGDVLIDAVKILPVVCHSPTHAFITISSNCKYTCAFCNSPALDRAEKTDADIVRLTEKAVRMGVKSFALTSGIIHGTAVANNRLARVAELIAKIVPDGVIGVETYVERKDELLTLKNAGVSEIKLNLQTSDRDIFRRVCPYLDYEAILERITDAIGIFGRGKVCSNIIIGMGENDESVLNAVDMLATAGAVATIRPLSVNRGNRVRLENVIGDAIPKITPQRLLRLAEGHRKILAKNRLSAAAFKTMCHNCACCDIVPGVDI